MTYFLNVFKFTLNGTLGPLMDHKWSYEVQVSLRKGVKSELNLLH